jgi:uncharacterized spore protein YtfJ
MAMSVHEPSSSNGANQGSTSTIRQSIQEILDKASSKGDVRRVYGEPIERNGRTIIPVADIGFGFGFGSGSGGEGTQQGEGGGGGGKVSGKPVGYIEIAENGSEFKPIYDATKLGTLVILGMTFLLWRVTRKR